MQQCLLIYQKLLTCISHELLIANLNAYGFDIKTLNFILAYFTSRKQKTKTGSSFNDFLNILFRIPQGSILGPLLFIIIYICDLFMVYDATEFASYAYDTTPYTCGQSLDEIIEKLEIDSLKFVNGFTIIVLKLIQEDVIFYQAHL